MSYNAHTGDVLNEVYAERERQTERFGVQNHPDGTGGRQRQVQLKDARDLYDLADRRGELTFRHILEEEVAEVFAETDPAALRTELIQVAAVAVAWVEAIDRRTAAKEET